MADGSNNGKKPKGLLNTDIKTAIIEFMSDQKERQGVVAALTSMAQNEDPETAEKRVSELKVKYDSLAPKINRIVRQHSERNKGGK